ncbi:MAG TPA: DUF3857 domain-containing protein, partial [Kofleriaceae bacterium]|nr:DUF3857 domain-containing protein [Kofleriaceae bacterium]
MRGWIGCAVVAAAMVGWSAAARADGALDKPAFTASPAELLALARAAPSRGDPRVVVLRDQRDTSFDARGRATVHHRRVYAVRAAIDPDEDVWASVAVPWVPYYQTRPVVRARVISPAGEVTELDPGQVRDAPMIELGGRETSDRRRLSAALPALAPGAVVEYEIASADRDPPPVAADLAIHRLDAGVPVASTVISFSAPVASKLRRVERGLPAGVRGRRERSGGRERWIYELAALQPRRLPELFAPDDARAVPYVGAAPAVSWAAVARDYGALIDRRIAEGRFALPAELPRAAAPETITAIVAWLHHQIRDTGVELEDTTRIPRTPAETVKRGAGDGKDRATLLVALLRQAGIRAELVLISATHQRDVDPDLPGISGFGRAIVRARLGGREVWIEPGEALLRPGQLPRLDQGRRALVIADGTTALATTPRAASGDNVVREVRSFTAAE